MMRKGWLAAVVLAALAAAQWADAWAHGGSRRSGFSGHHGGARFGPRHHGFVSRPVHVYPRTVFVAPLLYFPASYYLPPAFYSPPLPVTYIEQPKQGYWYFCPDSRQYYPGVQECPSGWIMVPPGAPPPP
jgi:hypothetical protein